MVTPPPHRGKDGEGTPKVPPPPMYLPPPPPGQEEGGGIPRYLSPPVQGTNPPPPPPPPRIGHHMEYFIRHGRYASCVHSGGLSCLIVYYNQFEAQLFRNWNRHEVFLEHTYVVLWRPQNLVSLWMVRNLREHQEKYMMSKIIGIYVVNQCSLLEVCVEPVWRHWERKHDFEVQQKQFLGSSYVLLPPAYVVRREFMFSQVSVC